MKYLLYYYGIINIITFILYFIDKIKAKHNKWRISEATLLLFAFLGGGAGALISMYTCHHKTKHIQFIILVPLSIILHVLLYIYVIR